RSAPPPSATFRRTAARSLRRPTHESDAQIGLLFGLSRRYPDKVGVRIRLPQDRARVNRLGVAADQLLVGCVEAAANSNVPDCRAIRRQRFVIVRLEKLARSARHSAMPPCLAP